MDRVILHCDMNNFYASVECMLNPALRDKCVAVCGSVEERHGIVLAKNYKAKAFGVQTGEPVWQAKQKCKDLIIVPPRFEEYAKYSRLARDIYYSFTDMVEPYGMDECWLDVTGSTGLFGSGEQMAHKIKESIKKELGLTISVGVSFNKIFAKLGSDLKKPDAVTCIEKDKFREKVWPLPVSDLLGVGRATKRKFETIGIKTIGDLAILSPDILKAKLGKNGVTLWRYANGLDTSPVMQWGESYPVKSFGHGITTVKDLQNFGEVWPVMLELTQDIGRRLRSHEVMAGGVQVTVRDNSLFIKEYQCRLPFPTQSPLLIAREAFLLLTAKHRWGRPLRSVTVRAIDLIPKSSPLQLDLFFDQNKLRRRERLEETIEKIRERFGKNAVKSCVLISDIKMPGHRANNLTMPTGMVN